MRWSCAHTGAAAHCSVMLPVRAGCEHMRACAVHVFRETVVCARGKSETERGTHVIPLAEIREHLQRDGDVARGLRAARCGQLERVVELVEPLYDVTDEIRARGAARRHEVI